MLHAYPLDRTAVHLWQSLPFRLSAHKLIITADVREYLVFDFVVQNRDGFTEIAQVPLFCVTAYTVIAGAAPDMDIAPLFTFGTLQLILAAQHPEHPPFFFSIIACHGVEGMGRN